jgi:hypothetical protein
MNNIVAEVNVEDIVKMDDEQLENLYSRLRGTTSTQRMFEDELFDIEKVGSDANMALSQIAFYTMTIGQEIQNRRNRLQREEMPSLSRRERREEINNFNQTLQTTPIQTGSRLRTKRSLNTQ